MVMMMMMQIMMMMNQTIEAAALILFTCKNVKVDLGRTSLFQLLLQSYP